MSPPIVGWVEDWRADLRSGRCSIAVAWVPARVGPYAKPVPASRARRAWQFDRADHVVRCRAAGAPCAPLNYRLTAQEHNVSGRVGDYDKMAPETGTIAWPTALKCLAQRAIERPGAHLELQLSCFRLPSHRCFFMDRRLITYLTVDSGNRR